MRTIAATLALAAFLAACFEPEAPVAFDGPSTEQNRTPVGPNHTEAVSVDQTPVAMVAVPGGIIVCGEYYKDNEDSGESEEGYWVWHIDDKGTQVWTREFVSEQQESPVILVSDSTKNFMLMGQRFVDGVGFMPFLRTVVSDGTIGDQVNIATAAIPETMIFLPDGSWLIAGSSDEAPEKQGKDAADWDAWMTCVNEDGSVLWQKWLDKQKDESIYAVANAGNGNIMCLANSGKLDKFGSGTSMVWLFEYSPTDQIVREETFDQGLFTAGGNGLMVLQEEQVVIVYSLPKSAVAGSENRDPFTFPARILSCTRSFDEQWSVEFLDNRGIVTPRIAATTSAFVLATAGPETPMLTSITARGALGTAIPGQLWEFEPILHAESLLVRGTHAFVAGSVTNFMSEDDSEKTFIACYDLEANSLRWQRTY